MEKCLLWDPDPSPSSPTYLPRGLLLLPVLLLGDLSQKSTTDQHTSVSCNCGQFSAKHTKVIKYVLQLHTPVQNYQQEPRISLIVIGTWWYRQKRSTWLTIIVLYTKVSVQKVFGSPLTQLLHTQANPVLLLFVISMDGNKIDIFWNKCRYLATRCMQNWRMVKPCLVNTPEIWTTSTLMHAGTACGPGRILRI